MGFSRAASHDGRLRFIDSASPLLITEHFRQMLKKREVIASLLVLSSIFCYLKCYFEDGRAEGGVRAERAAALEGLGELIGLCIGIAGWPVHPRE
jgi:hypothetical protein